MTEQEIMDLTFEFFLDSPINCVANEKLFTGRVVNLDSKVGFVEIEDETGLLVEKVQLQDIEFLAAPRGTVCYHYPPDREEPFGLLGKVVEILEHSDKDELHTVVESRVVEKGRLDHDEGVTLSQPSPEVSARSNSYSQWALVCQIARNDSAR
jgi:hypothetical protein